MKLLFNWIEDITTYGLEKIGLYYSRYRGWVVDNEDPLNLGRLRINVPEVHGENIPNQWAWPESNFAGNGYGAQVLPQKNDLIWVSFEKGNTRKPLWGYGYFAKGSIPNDLTGTKKYWFRSPGGYTILIDDENKTVSLYHKDGTLQPMVLGDTLESLLKEMIDLIKTMKINTQLGPQSILPFYGLEFDKIANKLKDFKSEINKLS